MWRRFQTLVVIGTALTILSVPARANADPIILTGGSVSQTSGNDLPGFTVSGSNSVFSGVLGISGVVCCVFSPGDLVRLNFFAPITALPFQPSTQIVNGAVYPDTFLRGDFRFTAAPFVAPPAVAGSESFSFTTSFDMAGNVSGSTALLDNSTDVFSVPIAGSGNATVSGSVDANSRFIGTSLAFEFHDSAPTPEPATLILAATVLLGGLAGATRPRRSSFNAAPRT
jgi:hypothetical protein